MTTPLPRPRLGTSLADATEAELVEAARERDEAAVRELIRRMNPRLFRVARGIAASDAEAEEIVQEIYLAAFTRLDTFRGEARFSTWITVSLQPAARTRMIGEPEGDPIPAEVSSGRPAILRFCVRLLPGAPFSQEDQLVAARRWWRFGRLTCVSAGWAPEATQAV